MPEFTQKYNWNSLYICLLILLYNICVSNYEYIQLFIRKIIVCDYISLFLFINTIGLYLFLKNITFEIHFNISYKNVSI
jgi:hypothetical protein